MPMKRCCSGYCVRACAILGRAVAEDMYVVFVLSYEEMLLWTWYSRLCDLCKDVAVDMTNMSV